jgi:hypothetical protein
MEVVIKNLAFFSIAFVLVFSFFWGLSEVTIGYDPKPEIPQIIDDTNMTVPWVNPAEMCDCYYIADEGSYRAAYQGTGCNIVNIKGIDRKKTPVCTAEVMQ